MISNTYGISIVADVDNENAKAEKAAGFSTDVTSNAYSSIETDELNSSRQSESSNTVSSVHGEKNLPFVVDMVLQTNVFHSRMFKFSASVMTTAIADPQAHSVLVASNATQTAAAPTAREVMDRYKRKRSECDRNALPSETTSTNRMNEQQLQRFVLLQQLPY